MLVFGLIVLGFVLTVLVVESYHARRLQRQLSEGADGAVRRSRWRDGGGWSDGGWGWGGVGVGGGGDCGGGGGDGGGGGGC